MISRTNSKTLVLGIGNTLLGDEGVGVHIVRRLQADNPAAEGVEFLDGGTLSFTLAAPIEEADQLIVIDAAELAAQPGTVRLFVGEEMDDFLGSKRKHSVHEVSLLDLMAVARLADHLPQRRALIGIQPQQVSWSDTPSGPVAQAIPEACWVVQGLMKVWQQ